MRATIVHVPKGFTAADWKHNYINFMPMGTYSVANYANARGHQVTILNTAIFGNTNAALDCVFSSIRGNDSQVVGMPLHWHFSGADVLFVAEKIKHYCPGVKIVLGGITASIFGQELMQASMAIDAVVHGDGEEPFCQFLQQVERGEKGDFSTVPNLRWRMSNKIVFNGLTYVASPEQFSSFDYGISKTVSDLRQYPNGPTMVDAVAGRTKDLRSETVEQKIFFVSLGRGCSYNCIYCAGCRQSFKTHFSRPAPMARSVDSVLETIKDAYRLGFRKIHFCWDCAFKQREHHLQELFRRVRSEIAEDISLAYEAYLPPTAEFLRSCSESFKHTNMILSPNFFEYDVMRRYMGYSYTLSELEASVHEMQRHPNCTPFIYFGITPLEDWSPRGLHSKLGIMLKLKQELNCRVSAIPIYAEPGSPWVTFPELFKNHTFPFSFDDFMTEWRKPLNPWNERLSGMKSVNAVVEQIDQAMAIDKLNEV